MLRFWTCLRGGCLTGPNHSGVELHGFLSYLVKCNLEEQTYRVFGYKGKQVRDQIHSADVIQALELFRKSPRAGEAYNLGGGFSNSASVLELVDKLSSDQIVQAFAESQGGNAGYYVVVQGTALNNFKLKAFTGAGAEIGNGVYPGSVTSDVVQLSVTARKLL